MVACNSISSNTADQELKFLGQGPQLETVVSTMNLDVLTTRFRCSDIFPRVKLELLREQDRKQPKRINLGCTVAQKLATSLAEACTGDAEESKLVLQVNVTVVSNGCGHRSSRRASGLIRSGSRRASSLLKGESVPQAKGMAKLTLAYCLYSRETGEVAVAKQLTASQERSVDDTRKCVTVLLELTSELCSSIRKEVFFMCCSKIPAWRQLSSKMLEVSPSDVEAKPTRPSNATLPRKPSMRNMFADRTTSFSSMYSLFSLQ